MENNFWQKINKPILALAPMAGITDSCFRQICKDFNADLVYSEMASSSALNFNSKKTLELLKFSEKERPYVVQLFGNNPEHFALATKIVAEKIKPDGIDINFGCPVKKVFKQEAGVSLMLNSKLSKKIVKAVCANSRVPVSIKIRSKIKNKTAIDFIKNLSEFPIKAIMIHARSYEQGFKGEIDIKIIKEIKKIFKGIVLANGGIYSPEKAKEILTETKVDGLGIARAAQGQPWIFSQIKDFLRTGEYKEKTQKQIFKIALKHSKLAFKLKKKQGIREMRKHLCWYVKNMPRAKELRQKIIKAENIIGIEKILK
ncbi:MAG: tRNA dihydrouridine synthase DusB [Xanthomonadaceae bacterium]|nr:tRNA dihydrouridine synthase DusB [Rhodospirillaceae bacterium]NIA17924.1 tRNA dihydrouridine synthase DusB [Xanthomonadaceae bacterium]